LGFFVWWFAHKLIALTMARIHQDAERAHFSQNSDQRAIVRPFLSGFDVTRAFWHSRGGDRIACFYLKPEQEIAELVGLEREVLLSYAPYPTLQARTLKLHDEVLASDKLRLDPMGSLLVTDDPDTRLALRRYVETDPERPPIVALSTGAVAGIGTATDLRTVLFEQLFQRDLFALESPLRSDTMFFGRDDIVSQLLDRYRSGQNSGLFGLRRIGKTSVLYALRRRIEAASLGGSAYLDLSNPSTYRCRWFELLQLIVRAFAEPLKLERADRSKVRALNITYGEKDAAAHFKADVQRLFEHHTSPRLLVLLDEIEHVTFDISPAKHWESDFLPFWQSIRSVHQDTQAQFCFVVVGVNPHILEADRVGQFDNPIFGTTKAFYLGPFNANAIRQMVGSVARYMGLTFDESLYERLATDFGGHPFLVRQACSHLARHVNSRPATLGPELYALQRQSIGVALEPNVKQILNVLAIWYPDEYELIRLLALGDERTFVEFASTNGAFTEHVEGYGLVTSARDRPRIRVGLVAEFLARVPQAAELKETMPTDWEGIVIEVSRRRNAIEACLRGVLRDGLRFALGKKAADGAFSAVPSERRAVLVQYGYAELWEELYFLELVAILDKHWEAFAKFFSVEKGQVMKWLEHINACRADAHAKALHSDDLAFLRVCFRRMELALGLSKPQAERR
jgi:hypothetical protein